ncbi:MAG: hypothetical protein JWQ95_7229 [Sphaerisporangium sp.]|nr:hypothetical protein [Sphaerisporangium sp.]
MTEFREMIIGRPIELRDYAPVLRWLLLNCLAAFGILVLWNFGLVQTMFETDRTHISTLILVIFAFTALHCLVQTSEVSRQLVAARKVRDVIASGAAPGLHLGGGRVLTANGRPLEPGIMTAHIANLITKSELQNSGHIDQTLLLRALADKLRNREKLGLFVSEALLRLALLGTAIGFILMLIPIAQLNSFDAETLRIALSGMTNGMAIALNVTVTGIASALVLKFEYYLLDGAIAELFDMITETTEIHVMPALERNLNART